jgi:hypothetical protein
LALAFILLNALVWWVLFSAGRSSLDTYGDMAEAYSWGISWQLGYDKHPPLSAWTAAAWFELFPTRDWAYYLLAMVNQAVAFWFVFLAGKRWLTMSARPDWLSSVRPPTLSVWILHISVLGRHRQSSYGGV